MTKRIICLLLGLGFYTGHAQAVNCHRAITTVDNTICNDDNLRWLDSIMSQVMLVKYDSPNVRKDYNDWVTSLEKCTSNDCIERAYYQGISLISGVDKNFDWQGIWWNTLTVNRSGGKLNFSRSAEWSFTLHVNAWSGANRVDFTAEARKLYGIAVIENIKDTSNCKLLLIPLRDGSLQVHSNADWGCRISMPEGVFVDGHYVKSLTDPRPKATLLSIGVFSDEAMDTRFRKMVGEDYQSFVDLANVYIYRDDNDNIGAKVISMWVRGEANRRTAIVMYTPEGDMWAARTLHGKGGVLAARFYRSKGNERDQLPRTLQSWKSRFLDQ